MTDLKLGKKDAVHDSRDLQWDRYALPESLPPLPPVFGQDQAIRDWKMLGNDRYGDCVFAGAAHESMLWNATQGRLVSFSDQNVLSDYGVVTGFDPTTGANDNGTDMRSALRYRKSTGIVSADGNRHRIGAFVALEPGNLRHIWEALWLFGAVGLGLRFPDTAFDQFNSGHAWTVRPGAVIDGGHYVPLVGKHSGFTRGVSWGRLVAMSQDFIRTNSDEAYSVISMEWLKDGRSIGGFDLQALSKDLQQLAAPGAQVETTQEGGSINMTSDPTQPPVDPAQPPPGTPGTPDAPPAPVTPAPDQPAPAEQPAEQPAPAQPAQPNVGPVGPGEEYPPISPAQPGEEQVPSSDPASEPQPDQPAPQPAAPAQPGQPGAPETPAQEQPGSDQAPDRQQGV